MIKGMAEGMFAASKEYMCRETPRGRRWRVLIGKTNSAGI
jgi:hypothetical protein